ncbi:MAG: DUF4232 domain-containing protein [Solirubrobacteraceae bacterium]|jgi:hypothetical protein
MRIAATAVALALAALVCAVAATAAGPPLGCVLQAWAGNPGVGARTIGEEYGFLNVGLQTCVIRGYPAVTMLNDFRLPMPTIVRRVRSGVAPYGPVQLVVLRTGERALFSVSWADGTGYAHARCPTSTQLLLTPPGTAPGDGHAVVLSGPQARITPYGGTDKHVDCGVVYVGPVHLYTPTNY